MWLFLYYITNVIIFISGTSRKIRQRDSYTTKPRSKSSTRSLTPCAFICSQYPTQSRRSLLQRLLQLITGQVTFKVFMATKKWSTWTTKPRSRFFRPQKQWCVGLGCEGTWKKLCQISNLSHKKVWYSAAIGWIRIKWRVTTRFSCLYKIGNMQSKHRYPHHKLLRLKTNNYRTWFLLFLHHDQQTQSFMETL